MEESYKCRFCFKSFINGRALGGHMRSHMSSSLRSDDEEDEERPSLLSDETESNLSSSSSEEQTDDLKFGGESEAESSRNMTRKRSKRTSQLHSSVSDTTTEEDLAFCLMMLSRDNWKKNKTDKDEAEESEGYNKSRKKNRITSKGRYKCETCGKVFKSYQALGGHRASHKKNKVCNKTEYDNVVVVAVAAEKRIHQCPICLRVFSSGQALGGHKRSHGIGNLSVNHHQVHQNEDVKQRIIDLNLPAPTEEDEVSVVFQ